MAPAAASRADEIGTVVDRETRDRCAELLELQTLAGREEGLSRALAARFEALEAELSPLVESQPVRRRDLEEVVRRSASWQELVPGAAQVRLLRASDTTMTGLQVLSALILGGSATVGSAFGVGFEDHLALMATGPWPVLAAYWGVVYPWLMLGAARSATPMQAGLPTAETWGFGVLGMLMVGFGLWDGTSPSVWVGGSMASVAAAVLAATLVRPHATSVLLTAVSRAAEAEGRSELASGSPAASRLLLEQALILDAHPPSPSTLAALRTAIVLEAQALRDRGARIDAHALVDARGLSPSSPETLAALETWAEEAGHDRAPLFEAAGACLRAAQAYREAGRKEDALRAYRSASTRGVFEDRMRAWSALLDLGEELEGDAVAELVRGGTEGGPSSHQAVRLLSRLPREALENEGMQLALQRGLVSSPAERAVSLLESLVGSHAPAEAPRLHTLLARAYRKLGHVSTARKIEAEVGPHQPPPSLPEPPVVGAEDLSTGDLAEALSGRYQLVSRLGSGAMGEVHLAEDLMLGRRVALKVLRPHMASALFVEKFRAEARLVARLDHAGIVRAFDAGQAGAWIYFVMEFVDGPDLATLMAGTHLPPLADRVRWAAEVAEAMDYAHSAEVIHRDLKPANVLVDGGGRARVTDFGIAHEDSASPEATAFARAGLQVGTPEYMAPEQLAHGTPASAATDLYALGVTLYFLLTGKLPFEDDVFAKLESAAPTVPQVSPALANAVACALAREPEARWPSMRTFAESLRHTPELDERVPARAGM